MLCAEVLYSIRPDQNVSLSLLQRCLLQEYSRIGQRFPTFAVGLRWSISPPLKRFYDETVGKNSDVPIFSSAWDMLDNRAYIWVLAMSETYGMEIVSLLGYLI